MAAKKKKKLVPSIPTVEQNKNNFVLFLSLVAVLTLGIYYSVSSMKSRGLSERTTMDAIELTSMPALNPIVVLNEQNNSKEYGNATFSEVDGKAMVRIELENAPRGVSQPAHIHSGSCIGLGEVVYNLKNVVNGVSETTLEISLTELASQLPLAVNVHKSTAQSKTYVSCGNLEIQ